jgi:hypothetical protein
MLSLPQKGINEAIAGDSGFSEKTPSRLLANRARPLPGLVSSFLLRLWLAFSFYLSQHYLKRTRAHSCISPKWLVQ